MENKYFQRKQKIKEAAKASNRNTFNKGEFDQLGTALLNSPDTEVRVATTKGGEFTEKVSTPIADLRKAIIGGIMKEAGHDSAEQAKFVENYEFGTLPLYPFVSELLEGYLDCGKAFSFQTKEDMKATLKMKEVPEQIKEVKAPINPAMAGNAESAPKRRLYEKYRKIAVESNCPSNKRKNVE